jgi:hypothetical protein
MISQSKTHVNYQDGRTAAETLRNMAAVNRSK